VVGRRPEQARAAAALAGAAGAVGSAESTDRADLVVNATPVGMVGVGTVGVGMVGVGEGGSGAGAGSGELPFGLEEKRLGPGQLVADLIYAPAVTPLLAAARARGAETCNGLGMLIHQAARQLETWTGCDAPVEVMSAAALRELLRRSEAARVAGFPQLPA